MELQPSFDNLRNHVISFETANGLTWEGVISYVKPEMAKPLVSLTLNDLSIYPGIGIYLFYNMRNELIYVGKCTSKSFIEWVPSHFDCRKHAQYATVAKRCGGETYNSDDISEISLRRLKELKVFLVNFTYDTKFWRNGDPPRSEDENENKHEANLVGHLESSIIKNKKPILNSCSKKLVQDVEC